MIGRRNNLDDLQNINNTSDDFENKIMEEVINTHIKKLMGIQNNASWHVRNEQLSRDLDIHMLKYEIIKRRTKKKAGTIENKQCSRYSVHFLVCQTVFYP